MGFDPIIKISDRMSVKDEEKLRDDLYEYNCAATGFRDGRSLSCFLKDGRGKLIAGISGYTWGGYAQLDYLWVEEGLRRSGLGSKLLMAAEEEARSRGCTNIVLDTHSFQAPEFYPKHGYVQVGRTDDTPVGHYLLLFQKTL
jgi:GNAT superfamily N-acetyltransferase